jgi:DNA-binding transcriptional regulator of glucitol operon
VPHAYRFVLAPKWVLGHVIVLAVAVAMVLLGRWQLDVSDSKHFSLQNFGYALQWWAFTIFALGLWGRILRDAARSRATEASGPAAGSQRAEPGPAPAEPVAYRRYVMPQSGDGDASAGDPELAAYNDYLARLAAGDPAREEKR